MASIPKGGQHTWRGLDVEHGAHGRDRALACRSFAAVLHRNTAAGMSTILGNQTESRDLRGGRWGATGRIKPQHLALLHLD